METQTTSALNPAIEPAKGQVFHLPVKLVPALESSEQVFDQNPDASELAQAYERFQLQVRLDVENERELLYKSLLVVEVLILLFVMRELLLRWLA
jgi:hypothetical protein